MGRGGAERRMKRVWKAAAFVNPGWMIEKRPLERGGRDKLGGKAKLL